MEINLNFKLGDRVTFTEGDGVTQGGTFHSYVTIAGNKDHCRISPDDPHIANELRLIHLFYVKPEKTMHHNQSKLIGDEQADPKILNTLREKGGRWAAFQNHDLSSKNVGHLKFLQFGQPHNTFPTSESLPRHYPEITISQGHNYLLVGEVDLANGNIKDLYL